MRGRTAFVLLAVAGAAYVALTASQLPPRVAIHFGWRGFANGWSSLGGYLIFLAGFGWLLPLAIVALVGRLAVTTPEALNVPGKEYWFHSDRRAEGAARVTERIWWLGALLLGFAVAMHAMLLVANAQTPARLPNRPFLALLGGFLVAVGLWTWRLHVAMRPPAGAAR